MTENMIERKKVLRREKRLLRESLSAGFRRSADSVILKKLMSMKEFTGSGVIAAYAGDGSETDLFPLLYAAIDAGKAVCLPRLAPDNNYEMAVWDAKIPMVSGKWNIPEPAPGAPTAGQELLKDALWLVPGVAFDENCARLGRGKGVYDSFLANISGPCVGIFYECQKTDVIPLEAHDRLLDAVVTEKRIYRNSKKKQGEIK